ncbi:hypothetical protein D3C86_2268310 [compost metagenome]
MAENLKREVDAVVANILVAVPELSIVTVTPVPGVRLTLNSPVALASVSVGIPEHLTFHLLSKLYPV